MNEILNNLVVGEILYTTSRGTNYFFRGRSTDFGVKYSINQSQKTIPLLTINTAFNDFLNGIEINSNWYKNFNDHEYGSRGCNLPVLRNLLIRLNR
jgi:hypothetical protein